MLAFVCCSESSSLKLTLRSRCRGGAGLQVHEQPYEFVGSTELSGALNPQPVLAASRNGSDTTARSAQQTVSVTAPPGCSCMPPPRIRPAPSPAVPDRSFLRMPAVTRSVFMVRPSFFDAASPFGGRDS